MQYAKIGHCGLQNPFNDICAADDDYDGDEDNDDDDEEEE